MRRESHQAAGVVLFRQSDGERTYLLLRSRLTRTPMWEFPKGGVEAGETELEAAERELREETGLAEGEFELREGFRQEERYFFTLGQGGARVLVMKRVTYFLAEGRTDRIRISHEASDYRWLSYPEARRLLRFRAKQEVLDRAEEWLSGPA
jgi:bis(5'-nucleosidyl)-tetraphosphatase